MCLEILMNEENVIKSNLQNSRRPREKRNGKNGLPKVKVQAALVTMCDKTTLQGHTDAGVRRMISRKVVTAEYDAHVAKHIEDQRLDALRIALEEAQDDKEGVAVSARRGVDFGVLDPEQVQTVEVTLSITSNSTRVVLHSSYMKTSTRQDEHGTKFSARMRGKSKVVQQGATRKLSVVFHPSNEGHYEDTLNLVFYHPEKEETFIIARTIEATVGSREDYEQLQAKSPYKRRKALKFHPVGSIVPSLRPPNWTATQWAEKLPKFDPPSRLIKEAFGPDNTRRPLAKVKAFMPQVLNEKTYAAWFQVLIFVDEEHTRLELDNYSMTDVQLEPDYPRYKLHVQGLAENRPSVLVGDFILVSPPEPVQTINTRTWFEGRVHKVYENYVSLRFGDSFSTYRGTTFDVRFVLNRLPYRRMHHALVNKYDPPRILFPGPAHIRNTTAVTPAQIAEINPRNRPIKEDAEQMQTIAAIVNQIPGSVPFIVFGPPGTGKTVTIIEAMLELLDRYPDVHILACAPNNSAADTLAVKLMHRGRTEVFRLNSLSRKLEDLTPDLRPFSLINENTVFAMPTKDDLLKYRVVVATCLSAGVPANLGIKRGHFTHIFVDEAGQGKEPEIMVAIKSNADDRTNIILAGDNQQLGPIIHSPVAGDLGLRKSYLARLMEREIYDLKNFRGKTIVKLVKNFRSHPDILAFSNQQFYSSELQACGNPVLTHSLTDYSELPKKQFPLMFHAIVGKDEREASSPSFFNIAEATQVKKYCLSLIDNRKKGIKAEHIGVITPYHAQRCKILDLLRKDMKLRDIKVGSVEEFQGQERRVIIMSTVRSNKDFITSDIRRSLGFVAHKQRLNVALTRAQALLIVVGNPVVLSLDPLWRAFLSFVYLRGGWKGKKIDWDPNEPIDNDFAYDKDRRAKMEGEMEEDLAKIRAMIMQKHAYDGDLELGDDEDDDAMAFERPILREAE
ncbi:RNA helicase [Crepidotus variabilis]|uniref:RNA helicase n=1 Tax=Crepidotus variabilis TaxID=179855 RepID=A0A9P6EE90_9AGAR|nr:RNA helicase [Crepidotus variabilis]